MPRPPGPNMEVPQSPEQEGIINNVQFVPILNKRDQTFVKWRSSQPGMKSVELDPGNTLTPVEHAKYQVQIVTDTAPGEPEKGMFIVKILKRQGKLLSAGEWQEVEATVEQAEMPMRKSKAASRELMKLTGVPRAARTEEEARSDILQQMNNVADQIMFQTAENREGELELEADSLLGLGDPISPERIFVGFRQKNLTKALRKHRSAQRIIAEHRMEEAHVLASIKETPSPTQLEVLADIRSKIAAQKENLESMVMQNPEAFYGIHLSELKEYKRELTQGRIVETPYVKEKADDIVTHVVAGKPVMIYGHLGSGKTELAMHVAKKYIGKEALVISGSKHTSLAELYGHQILEIDKIDKKDLDSFIKNVENKYEAWAADHEKASEHEKRLAHDRILQTYLAHAKGGTVSDFFLGPIYKAMDEGRPVIIDEVNAIPHEVLISLNHILTRRPGDTMSVQQDSGRTITVKPGFGILMTGNLNQGDDRYVDRQDMDPAFLSRLYKLEYDYLPQKTEGEIGEANPKDELFSLLIARLMDKNGDITAPEHSRSQLWRLAEVARVTQDLFAGREVRDATFRQGRDRPLTYFLKQSVLSIRSLDNIITQWQREGYRYELDEYVWKEFISQATDVTERAFLYQLFHDRFGFFSGEGWGQNPDYGSGGNVSAFRITSPKRPAEKIETVGPRATVETIFGKGPGRIAWPEYEVAKEEGRETEPEPSTESPPNGPSTEIVTEQSEDSGVAVETLPGLLITGKEQVKLFAGLRNQVKTKPYDSMIHHIEGYRTLLNEQLQKIVDRTNISETEQETILERASIRVESRAGWDTAVSGDYVLFDKDANGRTSNGDLDDLKRWTEHVFKKFTT